MLNLPNWVTVRTEESDHDYNLLTEYIAHPDYCPKCGSFAEFYKHSVEQQFIRDSPVHGKRVGITVKRTRFKCRDCGKTFMPELPDKHPKHDATRRLVSYIEHQSLRRTFASIAEDTGVDDQTVTRMFLDYVQRLEILNQFETPDWLGIDELHVVRHPRCIMTNIRENTIFDLLPNRNKPTVIARLLRMEDRQRVEWVTMDMWQPYRDAVHVTLPQASIVIDKFHVVKMASAALDSVRKTVRASLTDRQWRTLMHDRFILLKRESELNEREQLILQSWLFHFPTLGKAYRLKEEFYSIYDAADRTEAHKRYDDWLLSIPTELELAYRPVVTATRNWNTEIFNYFDNRVTNAYTESLNGIAKNINRLGRGYSFAVLRAKLLYAGGIHVQKKPQFTRTDWSKLQSISHVSVPYQRVPNFPQLPRTVDVVVSKGVDISTLLRMLETGQLNDDSTPYEG